MVYDILFHEHVSDVKIEQFLMRLNEIGIDSEQTGKRQYILTTTRQGKLERLQFFLFKSAYTRLFNVTIANALKNDSRQQKV